jgi:hypothetical protein
LTLGLPSTGMLRNFCWLLGCRRFESPLSLQMGPIDNSETSVAVYQSSLRHFSEEWLPHSHHGGSPRSRIIVISVTKSIECVTKIYVDLTI